MHLAAESHVDRSITGAGIFVDTNVTGTFTLLEAARAWRDGLPGEAADAFRFLHVSTDEVFGSLGAEGLFSETTAYDPSSPYSASKGRHRTILPVPGAAPTGSTCWCRTVRTITARGNSRKS